MALKDSLAFKATPIYLMDASAFIFKGFYGNMKMTRVDDFPVGAIYSVARVILKILREEQPEYFAFIKDGKGKNFRHEIFPLYKANRSATPEELVMQFAPIEEMVKKLGIYHEVSENCEADDCIASLAKKYRENNHIVIVGIDKDLRQCLHSNVSMWEPSNKESKIVTLDSFRAETGFEPEQWPDIQAVIGDSSDNIPGVQGIGPKTAEKIFHDFPNLEAIRDNFSELPVKLQTKFEHSLESMFMYRELTTLNTLCCKNVTLQDLQLQEIDFNDCIEFFRVYEMHSLIKELNVLKNKNLIKVKEGSYVSQEIFGTQSNTSKKKSTETLENTDENSSSAQKTTVKNAAESSLKPVVKKSQQMSLFDLLDPQEQEEVIEIPLLNSLKGIEVGSEKVLSIIPSNYVHRNAQGFNLAFGEQEIRFDGDKNELLDFIKLFETIVCVDYKHILSENYSWLKAFTQEVYDLSLISYLLNAEQRDYSWGKVSGRFRDRTSAIPFTKAATLALALKSHYIKLLEDENLLELYKKIELKLVPILVQMEQEGIKLDTEAVHNFLVEVQKDLDSMTSQIYSYAGREFNIRSAQQTGDILYNTLKLPTAGKTKGGQSSTSQETLEKLAGKHPIIESLLEYRKLEKLRSTYLEPLPKLLDATGRLHTSFNHMATATGRLSSSNPNLQNIPIRGKVGQRMRSCFVAEKGNLLISADYSQIELRVLAHYSQEPALIDAFKKDEDIHKSTAALLNNVALEEVTLEQRQAAKTINFGLLYGMGARKLAQDIKITTKEAQLFIEQYFERFKGIKSFYDRALEEAKEHKFVTTIAGRKRQLPDLYNANAQARALAERQAVNTLIQGSAADIIKLAMLHVSKNEQLKDYNVKLLLQVHDELILSVPKEHADIAGTKVAELMSNAMQGQKEVFTVPLKVEFASAENWLLAH